MLLGSSWHKFTVWRQQPAMEAGKYLENLKADCFILFLSQVICGWCSPPGGREGGEWLRREPVEFTHSGPAGPSFVLVQGRMEGEERALLVHLRNKEFF